MGWTGSQVSEVKSYGTLKDFFQHEFSSIKIVGYAKVGSEVYMACQHEGKKDVWGSGVPYSCTEGLVLL